METLKNPKAIALVTTALFVGSLFWLMNTHRINSSLEAGLHDQKVKSEELLSEKLFLERDIQKLKDQLAALRESNQDLNDVYRNASAKLEEQESEFKRMRKENASLLQIKKQRQELIALQSQLENEIQQLKTAHAMLQAENMELNRTVVSLEERNLLLREDLNKAMFAAVDQSQIQALKGKTEKLTVKARATRKLITNFEVPANLKNLSFRITDPGGRLLSDNDGTIASNITPSDNNVIASSASHGHGDNLQKVQVSYVPKQRLKTGVYTVEILNDNLYVGSLKVKLK